MGSCCNAEKRALEQNKSQYQAASVHESNPRGDVYKVSNEDEEQDNVGEERDKVGTLLQSPDSQDSPPPAQPKLKTYESTMGGIRDKYTLGPKLGQGSFASVRLATRNSDEKKFAVKVISKAKLRQKRRNMASRASVDAPANAISRDEATIMRKLKHNNCCGIVEVFESRKKIYLVLELCEGGDIFEYWKDEVFSEQHAARVIKSVALGLQYLHSHGIIHRDIKPENLLYTKATETTPSFLKITDFGLSIYRETPEVIQAKLVTVCGTEIYMAPEMLSKKGYDKECDLWSVGVMLYELLAGYPPFIHNNPEELMKSIKEGKVNYPEKHWAGISKEAKEVVSGLLTVDVKERWKVENLLSSKWVTGCISSKAFSADYKTRMHLTRCKHKLRKHVRSVINLVRIVRVIHYVTQQVREPQ